LKFESKTLSDQNPVQKMPLNNPVGLMAFFYEAINSATKLYWYFHKIWVKVKMSRKLHLSVKKEMTAKGIRI
jgi:hypothetical protein